MKVLMPTDLPEPVVPAISRCGMRARSAMIGSPPMVLPRQMGSLPFIFSKSEARQHLAQIDGLAGLVGQLDADGVAARDHCDAGRNGAHRAGDVVGERDDAGRLDAGRRLELVERDDRAGSHIDDVALDAEILEHALEPAGHGLELFGPVLVGQALVLGLGEEAKGRQFEALRIVEERGLRLARRPRTLRGARRPSGDAGAAGRRAVSYSSVSSASSASKASSSSSS
jgi:hypothetical protein